MIRKRRPAWQAGRLNGIGGKMERGETALEAMQREFREEAGLDIADWREIVTLTGKDWRGHFFRGFGDIDAAYAVTDEQLERYDVDALPPGLINNLYWMIPLMLDEEVVGEEHAVEVLTKLTPKQPF